MLGLLNVSNISIHSILFKIEFDLYFSTAAVESHVVVIFLIFGDVETESPHGGSAGWVVHVTVSFAQVDEAIADGQAKQDR
jgi:hypothetical protein